MTKQLMKHIKENFSIFKTILFCSLVAATVICIVSSVCHNVIFVLNENQLLYLFSAMAQVIGGMFGLTLTAYVFFVNEFREFMKDNVVGDAARSLVSRDFQNFIFLAINCGVAICFCIIGIIDLHNWMAVYSFIIDESIFLFVTSIAAILIFGIILLDPNRLDKEVKKKKRSAEKYFQTTPDSKSGDFKDFLKTYNLLERLVIDFAEEYTEVYVKDRRKEKNNRNNYKSQIIQSLRALNLCEIISKSLVNEINELRMYRNGLVHGVDFNVTEDVCVRISEIYNTLKDAFDILKENDDRKESEEWNEAIKKIYGLSR